MVKEKKWMKLRNKQSFNFDLLLFKKKKLISIDSSFWLNTNIFLT